MEDKINQLVLNKAKSLYLRYCDALEDTLSPEINVDYASNSRALKVLRETTQVALSYKKYLEITEDVKLAKSILSQPEIDELETERLNVIEKIREALLPESLSDDDGAILEIRALSGGATKFLGEVCGAYISYCRDLCLNAEIINSECENMVDSSAVIVCESKGTYGLFRHESGILRAQYGKKSNLDLEVIVLPLSKAEFKKIPDEDIKIDVYHSGGAGGQNINKVATAIRMTHLPTGITVTCQNERSQLQNRNQARRALQIKLYEYEKKSIEESLEGDRQKQRSSLKLVRTYDYTKGVVYDALGTSIKLMSVLEGRLQDFIDNAKINELV